MSFRGDYDADIERDVDSLRREEMFAEAKMLRDALRVVAKYKPGLTTLRYTLLDLAAQIDQLNEGSELCTPC